MYRWYNLARERSVQVSKKRHNLRQFTVSEEAAWGLRGYSGELAWKKKDSHCGLWGWKCLEWRWGFYKALPEKTLGQWKKECKGGKTPRKGLLLHFWPMHTAGGKMPPIVMGKAAKPWCFKGIKDPIKPEGIPYYSHPAWMNGEIMAGIYSMFWISSWSCKQEKRMHASLHWHCEFSDPVLKDKFSIIKIIFMSKNMTSKLQPLDTEIIEDFKVHYWQLALKHRLAQIDSNRSRCICHCKNNRQIDSNQVNQEGMGWSETSSNHSLFQENWGSAIYKTKGVRIAGLKEDDICFEELVTQLDPDTTADQYMTAHDCLSTSLFDFRGHRSMEGRIVFHAVTDKTPSLSKQIRVEDNDSEDDSEDVVEPERCIPDDTPACLQWYIFYLRMKKKKLLELCSILALCSKVHKSIAQRNWYSEVFYSILQALVEIFFVLLQWCNMCYFSSWCLGKNLCNVVIFSMAAYGRHLYCSNVTCTSLVRPIISGLYVTALDRFRCIGI